MYRSRSQGRWLATHKVDLSLCNSSPQGVPSIVVLLVMLVLFVMLCSVMLCCVPLKMLTVLISTRQNSQVFLLKRMWEAFANAKTTHIFFSKHISIYAIFNDQSFNVLNNWDLHENTHYFIMTNIVQYMGLTLLGMFIYAGLERARRIYLRLFL